MTQKMGDQQLLHELERRKISPTEVEAVRLGYETENGGFDIPPEHVGVFSLGEALFILEGYVIEEQDWGKKFPTIAITVWTTNTILFTHDYDCKYEIRSVARNPPRE